MNNEKFKVFLEIQNSGKTNMLEIRKVLELSRGKLTRADVFDILENYGKYFVKFIGLGPGWQVFSN